MLFQELGVASLVCHSSTKSVRVREDIGTLYGSPGHLKFIEWRQKITVTIPQRALTESWERYGIYSSYVTKLGMFEVEIQVNGLNALITKSGESENPFLSNLECLDAEPPDLSLISTYNPIHQIVLCAPFLSSSNRKIEFRRSCPGSYFYNPTSLPPQFLFPSALLLVNNLAKSFPTSRNETLPSHYNHSTKDDLAIFLTLGAQSHGTSSNLELSQL
ncbi:hypothetical protein B0J17DRAFT_630951 [Rhizoctonia solani]|nr:hypothetical protein B0J17DRAFT_630951 [Rhizoctonia solani]